MRRMLPVLTMVLLLSAPACSKSPTGLEALPETLETVQAAVDLITTDTIYFSANCPGNPSVDCPGGVAGSPVPMALTRDSAHVMASPTPGTYSFTAWVTAVTVRDVPISTFGIDCGMAIDTRAAPTPTIQVNGSAYFTSQTPGGPINRLNISNITIAGLDAADVTLHGGIGCDVASYGLSFFLGTLTSTLQGAEAGGLCGAPGAKLLEPCPAQVVAARQEGRQHLR